MYQPELLSFAAMYTDGSVFETLSIESVKAKENALVALRAPIDTKERAALAIEGASRRVNGRFHFRPNWPTLELPLTV